MARILVIDSEPIVRSVVVHILERSGHTVVATGEFENALHVASQDIPDLVLTNVFLKGITGHDAMKRLKDALPSVPVLMVSGLPDEDVVGRWTNETGFDVFPKPFLPRDLVSKVDGMLARGAR